MKNSELWEQYQKYTLDLTANSRKLAYVAGGLCWFFKDDNNTFPPKILMALFFLVLFFLFDLLHYFITAVIYRRWIRSKEKTMYEKTGTIEGEYDKPVWLDYPAFTCWFIKFFALLAVYSFLGWHILKSTI